LGHIDVAHVFSDNQLANMFTKPLGKMKFEHIKAKLRINFTKLSFQRFKEQ
jgi:hypothetical protein